MEANNNLVVIFFAWWYGEATARLLVFIKRWFAYLTDLFSVRVCLTTLLAPWKRDSYSMEGLSLQDRFQVFLMNQASRLVGAAVKVATLLAFIITILAAVCLSALVVLLWLVWPLVIAATVTGGLILFGSST